MPIPDLRFTRELLSRPAPGKIDVVTRLRHFAIVSYAVAPDRVTPHLHPRFECDCFAGDDGAPRVWVSIVPFEDQDFRFVRCPWPKFRFGQTNYRTYVIDRATGARGVWFFGTSLASWTVAVPRFLWKLPWHAARMQFDCDYDAAAHRYRTYHLATRSAWAPVELELEDTGAAVERLAGFDNLESGLVLLTHPLIGLFYRRDGQLGTYRVWHDRLHCTEGRMRNAKIGLFDRLGLVPFSEQSQPHSVLIQPESEFTIYLPPGKLPPAPA